MDLVNIIYRYINRFINSEELMSLLENIDRQKFSDDESKEIDNFLKEVKKIIKTTPNKIDIVEEKRLENINRMLALFEKNIDSEKLDEKGKKLIEKQYNSLLRDKEKVRDSGPRYEKLFEHLCNFPLYRKYCLKMDDYELLKFIAQYISVPLPPKISQEAFNDLVEVGIKSDERESLWRLAMNYNRKEKDFSKIEDYFILKRDNYYLAELISGVEENLDLNRIVEKILKTNDIEFIKKMANTPYLDSIFTDEQKEKIKNKIKNEKRNKNERI